MADNPKTLAKEQRLRLRSTTQTQPHVQANVDGADKEVDSSDPVASKATECDMAQIHEMLSKILEDTAEMKEIRRSVGSMDAKLTSLVTRITEVEERVSKLEDEQASGSAVPAVTKADLQQLTDRLADAEDRSRRNNLRFVGIPEGSEKNDMTAFLNQLISTSLGINPPPGGIEMDRAHRIGARLARPTGEKSRDRTIIARFLRYKDCQNILEEARKKRRITWDNQPVMIFPDYSMETQRKREAFNPCKRALHERKIKFSLLYPARLRIHTDGNGSRVFASPETALQYIERR